MANTKTSIEWTATRNADGTVTPGATWNPVTGCSHVSEGCRYCYAERVSHRFGHTTLPWGAQHASENVKAHPDRLDEPLRWRKPRRVFVNSMSDLFHEEVSSRFIAQVFAVMALAHWHTFQVLTKRPARMASILRWEGFVDLVHEELCGLCKGQFCGAIDSDCQLTNLDWPLPNVWLLTSCEDQPTADERVGELLRTPAVVHGLSLEPLLGPIELHPEWLACQTEGQFLNIVECGHGLVNWVIVGGESGGPPERRLVERCCGACSICNGQIWTPKPEALTYVRTLRDQCVQSKVPFLFKQWGGPTAKSAGRILDGRIWHQFPDGKGGIVDEAIGNA